MRHLSFIFGLGLLSLTIFLTQAQGQNPPPSLASPVSFRCIQCMSGQGDDCASKCLSDCQEYKHRHNQSTYDCEPFQRLGADNLDANQEWLAILQSLSEGQHNPFAAHSISPEDEFNHKKSIKDRSCALAATKMQEAARSFEQATQDFISTLSCSTNEASMQAAGAWNTASQQSVEAHQNCEVLCRDEIQIFRDNNNDGELESVGTRAFEGNQLQACKNAFINYEQNEVLGMEKGAENRRICQAFRQPGETIPGSPGGGADGTDDDLADNDDDKDSPKNTQARMQKAIDGLQQVGGLVNNFFAPTSSLSENPGYYNLPTQGTVPSQRSSGYNDFLEAPDYRSLGDETAYPEPDIPSPSMPMDYSEYQNANNAGAQGTQGGGSSGMGAAGGMMNNNAGRNQNQNQRNRGRRRPKSAGDRQVYTSRLEEQGPGSAFAKPTATTARASRIVSRDRNGNKVDQRFNPSKYHAQINRVYNKAINSRAARRRAAGHVSDILASRGYQSWHKENSIHPKSLSIFKQARVCYIIKYSTYSGSCGPE